VAVMIAITPLITPVAVRIGSRQAVVLGFLLSGIAFGALGFAKSDWGYGYFLIPLVVMAVGLGLANGPASAASTSAVEPSQVGQASGISNMARYVGGSIATAATATVYATAIANHKAAGATDADALAAGLSRASILLALMALGTVLVAVLFGRHRPARTEAGISAAAHSHTVAVTTASD